VRLQRHLAGAALTAATVIMTVSCATVQEKTESYLFDEHPGLLAAPLEAWLRTVEIVSNSIPLSEEYALIGDSLVATASKYGFVLSLTRGGQPYVVDLVMHERSSVVDLSTRNSVMAILNVTTSSEAPRGVARVVHSAVMPDSIMSLYRVTEIGEKVFASLRASVDERLQKEKEAGAKKRAAVPAP
jgi:hypothetical protein